jgi:DNA-binding CsgD family transcriptional regulator
MTHKAATRLTDREREIIALIASGMSRPDIAVKLGISERTVGQYLASARRVTGTHNTVELLRAAVALGHLPKACLT